MSLLDDHAVGHEGETWTLPDDPDEEAPLWWPEDERGPGPGIPT